MYNKAKYYYRETLKLISENSFNTVQDVSMEASLLIKLVNDFKLTNEEKTKLDNVSKFVYKLSKNHYKSMVNLITETKRVLRKNEIILN